MLGQEGLKAELKARLEQSVRAKDRRLDEALRQVQNLQSEVESLKIENARLKQQCDSDKATASDTHRTSTTQLTLNLSSLAFQHNGVTTKQPTVRETSTGDTEKTLHPTLLSAQEKVALFADLFAWRIITIKKWAYTLGNICGLAPLFRLFKTAMNMSTRNGSHCFPAPSRSILIASSCESAAL